MRLSTSLMLLTLTVPCFPQAMIEHAAAAAGGSTGALAGKPVGESLGKIFGKVEQTTAKAAKPKTDKTAKIEAPKAKEATGAGEASRTMPTFGAAVSSAGMPASSGGVTRHNRPSSPLAPVETEAAAAEPVIALTPRPIMVHQTTREDVVAIQSGMVRHDVIAKLGAPASSVTIPDDGHLLEIFKYVSGGRWVGTVRLDNGSVVKVDSAQ